MHSSEPAPRDTHSEAPSQHGERPPGEPGKGDGGAPGDDAGNDDARRLREHAPSSEDREQYERLRREGVDADRAARIVESGRDADDGE